MPEKSIEHCRRLSGVKKPAKYLRVRNKRTIRFEHYTVIVIEEYANATSPGETEIFIPAITVTVFFGLSCKIPYGTDHRDLSPNAHDTLRTTLSWTRSNFFSEILPIIRRALIIRSYRGEKKRVRIPGEKEKVAYFRVPTRAPLFCNAYETLMVIIFFFFIRYQLFLYCRMNGVNWTESRS